jgi:hypothetical protein
MKMPRLLDLYDKAYKAYKSMEDSRYLAYSYKAPKLEKIKTKYKDEESFKAEILALKKDKELYGSNPYSKSRNIIDVLVLVITQEASPILLADIEKLAAAYSEGLVSAWFVKQPYKIAYDEFIAAAKTYPFQVIKDDRHTLQGQRDILAEEKEALERANSAERVKLEDFARELSKNRQELADIKKVSTQTGKETLSFPAHSRHLKHFIKFGPTEDSQTRKLPTDEIKTLLTQAYSYPKPAEFSNFQQRGIKLLFKQRDNNNRKSSDDEDDYSPSFYQRI